MEQKPSAEKAVREIRRKTRRKFSAEEKIRIVIEGLRGEESIATLARLPYRPGHSRECRCGPQGRLPYCPATTGRVGGRGSEPEAAGVGGRAQHTQSGAVVFQSMHTVHDFMHTSTRNSDDKLIRELRWRRCVRML